MAARVRFAEAGLVECADPKQELELVSEETLDVVAGRTVTAILLTHAHDDHVRVAPELAEATGAPLYLHPAEEPLWKLTHPDRPMPQPLTDGQEIAGLTLLPARFAVADVLANAYIWLVLAYVLHLAARRALRRLG